MFFKIESWNLQHLFEKEFRETSQNFDSIRQQIQNMQIKIFWMSWNFARIHKIFNQRDAESFSFLSWKKSFIPKKKSNLGRSLYLGQESSNRWRFAVPIFREGFGYHTGRFLYRSTTMGWNSFWRSILILYLWYYNTLLSTNLSQIQTSYFRTIN